MKGCVQLAADSPIGAGLAATRLGLRVTPHGHLVGDLAHDAPDMDEAVASRVGEAFARGNGRGLLRLGAAEVGQTLPPVFLPWRGFATRYVTALCLQGTGTTASPVVPPFRLRPKANSPRWS